MANGTITNQAEAERKYLAHAAQPRPRRALGMTVAVCEHWNPFARHTQSGAVVPVQEDRRALGR